MQKVLKVAVALLCALDLNQSLCGQINYVPRQVGAYISLDGTGGLGTWYAMQGTGSNPIPYVPPAEGLYVSMDGSGNVGTWVPWTGSSTASLITGAIADYKFLNGSGTTVTDTSGNGNNATLTAGRSPSWIKNGLQFTGANQGVDLPAALNSGLTFEFLAYFEPMSQAQNGQCFANAFPLIMSSTQGLAGVNFLYAGDSVCGIYRLGAVANSSNTTQTRENFAGLHVITAVFGTGAGNLDHFYIDGIETTYTMQNFTGGKATSGHLFIGSPGVSPYAASGFLGKFYRMRVFNTQLSAQDVASDSAALTAELALRGVNTAPLAPTLQTPQLNILGDSISCASANGSTCTPAFSWATQLVLTNQPTYTLDNWAVYGTYISSWAASEPWRASPYCHSKRGANIAIIFGGANDARTDNAPTMGLSASAAIQAMKDAGCRVYIGTMISRSGNTQQPGTPSYDSQKDAFDALIGSSWKSWGADGMLDFAANPLMGADGASANTTYFQADGTHPTAAGQALLAAAASNTLNYYAGYTNSGPNIVTANTYQMASGDGAITAAPTANAAYTMPDCIGPSGATYTINNPQSAFTLSVVGKASQPINGLATPITIPSNSTVTLHDVPNDRSVSGCHWSM